MTDPAGRVPTLRPAVDGAEGARSTGGWRSLLPVVVVRTYLAQGGGNWAAAVALKLLLSLFPIVLAILLVVSLVLRDPATRDDVLAQIARVFPGGASGEGYKELALTVDAVREGTGLLAVVSLLGLLWGGAGLFGTIEAAFAAVYHFAQRGFVQGKLMAFGMIVVFGLLSVLGIAASSMLALLTPITEHTGHADVLVGPARYLIQLGVGVLAGVLLFGAIYVVVPRPRRRWGAVLPGALLAGAGFELITLLFPLYIGIARTGNRYGQTFGVLVLVISYAYLMAQVLVLGAVLNAALDPSTTPEGRNR